MDIQYEAQLTFNRLKPRLQDRYYAFKEQNPEVWKQFSERLEKYFPKLFENLFPLYGQVYDATFYIEELFYVMADAWIDRPDDLKLLDKKKESDPLWYQSNQVLGAVCYVDLFSENLKGFFNKIPYLLEMGVTYLHLMPLFKVPKGENDGGYAISSYREVNPDLGTIDELICLAKELRKNGISLVLDFVLNHTSFEHEWAKKARVGDPYYNNFYWIYPDRKIPDAYEAHLREIFPEEHSGAFTYFEDIDKWVWTTFHSYQWDLNYQNPAVFVQMAKEMLFLANIGVEILRLDAIAFLWKKLGTNCETLPEVKSLIQAFNCVARIASPALLFKSEAIVHPDDVIKYVSQDKCQLSYNPLLMALIWESLATREVKLLNHSMTKHFALPAESTWVNYVRCHDDIGWTFSDEDAAELWINGFDHRQFLNEFYQGKFPGSFARGLPFQENPITGDARISGTCASLAGLEKAINVETKVEVDLAVKRIALIHGIILTIGGMPLIYLGDEIGTLNDYDFRLDPLKNKDSRWVHRTKYNWDRYPRRKNTKTIEGKIYQKLLEFIELRKSHKVFGNSDTIFFDTNNPHVFCYQRNNENEAVIVFANFSEKIQKIFLKSISSDVNGEVVDLVTNQKIDIGSIDLSPYDLKFFKLTR
jgi:glycosidase